VDKSGCTLRARQGKRMRTIPAIARQQCGVFSHPQALHGGWTHAAVHHAVASGDLHRVRVGVYQVADLDLLGVANEFEAARWRHAGPAIAAVLRTYGSAASHSTAAVLRSMPLVFLPATPCMTVLPWATGEVERIHLHRCTRTPLGEPAGAVLCMGSERIAIDLAREHGIVAGVVALDYLLHRALTTVPAVQEELARCVRWPGVRAARTALSLADPRSESVLESRSRLKLAEVGLPEPELQVRIGNESGVFVARVDYYWEEFGVVGEADGDLKYDGTDPAPLLKEKKRQGLLEDLDLGVVRWGSADLRDFNPTAARLRRAFMRGQRTPRVARRWRVLPPL
jgi:hypothetical protein